MRTLKEIKIGVNNNNQIVFMELVNKGSGKTVETQVMIARLITHEDIDQEIKDLTEEERIYRRRGRRIIETR